MKKCFKCGIEKPLSEFYKHPQMGDGHLNKCKDCVKKDVSAKYSKDIVRPEYKEMERKRGRDKYRRLYAGTGKAKPENNQRYFEKYPEKRSAQSASDSLKKPFLLAEKHHWSYNQEHFKDVLWFTKKQHKKGHRFIIYDQERKMYRRIDTNELLDTNDKHEKYFKWCVETKED